MKNVGLFFVAVVVLLYTLPVYSAVIPVHEYSGKVVGRKVSRCPASLYPRSVCDEGMICDRCRDGSSFKYRFKKCKKGYTQKNQTCMRDCTADYVLGGCPVANGKCDVCTDAMGVKYKFLDRCVTGYGYNGTGCVVNCGADYKLTENQIDQTAGNYTPCTDWKNNKKRKVYRFDGCKTGYEDVDGLCQEVKLECVFPKVESNGFCVCSSEYRTVKPANAKVKVCVEYNGVKKYLFDGCEDEYELINDRCEKIKPVIPDEDDKTEDGEEQENEDEDDDDDDDEHEEPDNEGNDEAGEVICYNTCSDHNMNLASGHSNKSGYNTMLRSCATMEHDLPCHDPENIGCDNSYCTVECEAGTETNRCPEDRKSDAGTTKSSSSSTLGASSGGAGGSSGSMGVFPEPYKEDRVDKRLDVKMKHDVDDTGGFR